MSILGAPPPYYPAGSPSVMTMLVLLTSFPAFLLFVYRAPTYGRDRLARMLVIGYVVATGLSLPEVIRLGTSWRGAIELWLLYLAFMLPLALSLLLFVRQRFPKKSRPIQ